MSTPFLTYTMGRIAALNAEVEAMKAENQYRAMRDESPAYRDQDFMHIAQQLTKLANDARRAQPQ